MLSVTHSAKCLFLTVVKPSVIMLCFATPEEVRVKDRSSMRVLS